MLWHTNLSSNTVCKAFHPNAKSLVSVNGSKNGFYCDGALQTGLACGGYKNICEVCPACNANADCNTDISEQFREMYVECGSAGKISPAAAKPLPTSPTPPKTQPAFGPYPGNIACDFYQTKKKMVTTARTRPPTRSARSPCNRDSLKPWNATTTAASSAPSRA